MAVINLKLYSISFFDALSFGLLLPILAPQVIVNNGSHAALGMLASFYAAFQLISGPLVRSWKDTIGMKGALMLTTFINCLTYLPLGITTSYVTIILLRLVVAATNQTQTLCKAFVEEFNTPETHDGIYGVMSALTAAGFVVGPMVGGQMFDMDNGFYYICVTASAALAVCLLIGLTLPRSTVNDEQEDTSFIQKVKEDLGNSLSKLRNLNLSMQWDAVILKYLYTVSMTVFFMKFSLLLRLNYEASSASIGCTCAYQSILTFFSPFVVVFLKHKFSDNENVQLLSSLCIVTLSCIGLCYAPSYDIYMLSFIPMILAHTMMNSKWKQLFILKSTKENEIKGVENTVSTIASITTPIIFGVFCDWYGQLALKTFVIMPLILDLLVASVFNSNTPQEDNEKED